MRAQVFLIALIALVVSPTVACGGAVDRAGSSPADGASEVSSDDSPFDTATDSWDDAPATDATFLDANDSSDARDASRWEELAPPASASGHATFGSIAGHGDDDVLLGALEPTDSGAPLEELVAWDGHVLRDLARAGSATRGYPFLCATSSGYWSYDAAPSALLQRVAAGVATAVTTLPSGQTPIGCAPHALWTSSLDGHLFRQLDGDGDVFRAVEASSPLPPRTLFAAQDDDVWIAADHGQMARWTAGVWTRFAAPYGYVPTLTGTAVDDVWVATPAGAADQWDGTGMRDHSVPSPAPASKTWSFAAASKTEAWALFDETLWRWNGATWSTETPPASPGETMRALWVSSSYVWVVGERVWRRMR